MAAAKGTDFIKGTGRRKTAVARIRMSPGSGKILVNKRKLEEYFPKLAEVETVLAPLVATSAQKTFDISVTVRGGGIASQADAVQLGVARALIRSNDEYEDVLREKRYLTRDARKKERKKYGRAGARRSFQFSKR